MEECRELGKPVPHRTRVLVPGNGEICQAGRSSLRSLLFARQERPAGQVTCETGSDCFQYSPSAWCRLHGASRRPYLHGEAPSMSTWWGCVTTRARFSALSMAQPKAFRKTVKKLSAEILRRSPRKKRPASFPGSSREL